MSNEDAKSSKRRIPRIDILYEDTDMLAINKPAGIMVHSDGRAQGPFITDWVLKEYPRAVKVGEPAHAVDGTDIARPGIVHRLDRETSGVLLIAKTQKGFESLKEQFHARTIKKRYLAFVWGDLKEEFGTISRPIGRNGSDFRKWSASRGSRGEQRSAETYWTKIRTFIVPMLVSSPSSRSADPIESKQSFTLMEAEPKTGRTHQIRVHFSAIQHPVVSDPLYAPNRPQALGFGRTALHARSIEFDTVKGKRVKIEAPLPKDFKEACEAAEVKM